MDIKSRMAGAALGALLAMGIGSAGLAFAQSSDEPAAEAQTPAAAQEDTTAAQAQDDAAAQANDDATDDDTVNPEDCPEGAGRGPGGAVPTPEAEADAGTAAETAVQL